MTVYIHHRADGTTSHMQCDNGGGHTVYHTYERQPPRRLTMATDAEAERIIERAIARVRARRTTSPSRKSSMTNTSRSIDMDALMQRDPADRDLRPAFARAWESRFAPRRPRTVAHAYDGDPETAVRHLEHARNHIAGFRAGDSPLDAERLQDFIESALEALQGEAEDESEEERRQREWDNMSQAERDKAAGKPAPSGDRRRASAGADSALAYDAGALFQTGER